MCRIVLALFFIMVLTSARADIGSSIIYEFGLRTANNVYETVYFEATGYEEWCYLNQTYQSDRGVLEMLDAYQRQNATNKIVVYQQIHYPEYGFVLQEADGISTNNYGKLALVLKEDVIEVELNEIVEIRFKSIYENPKSLFQDGYVVTNSRMLELLDSKPFVNHAEHRHGLSGVLVLNYDTHVDEAFLADSVAKIVGTPPRILGMDEKRKLLNSLAEFDLIIVFVQFYA